MKKSKKPMDIYEIIARFRAELLRLGIWDTGRHGFEVNNAARTLGVIGYQQFGFSDGNERVAIRRCAKWFSENLVSAKKA